MIPDDVLKRNFRVERERKSRPLQHLIITAAAPPSRILHPATTFTTDERLIDLRYDSQQQALNSPDFYFGCNWALIKSYPRLRTSLMSSSNNFVPELSTTAPASESAQVHGNQSSGRRTGRGGRAGRGRGGLNAELVPGASDEQRERRRDGQKRTRRGGNVDRGRGLSGRSPWEQRQGYHQSDIREPDVAPGVDGDQPQIAIRRASTAETEAEVCFICASNVVHQSVAPCNHRTCHICALRLRALYKTKACAHCRVGERGPISIQLPNFTC